MALGRVNGVISYSLLYLSRSVTYNFEFHVGEVVHGKLSVVRQAYNWLAMEGSKAFVKIRARVLRCCSPQLSCTESNEAFSGTHIDLSKRGGQIDVTEY